MELGDEKVAIITGASRGIGAGLVEAYRKHGHRVVANSRTIDESPHPEVASVTGDIADPRTAERIVDEALVISVNVMGFFGVTQHVVSLRRRKPACR
jgi:NADP-dependent 3-hydroxy acid dehydrogenase YdfG